MSDMSKEYSSFAISLVVLKWLSGNPIRLATSLLQNTGRRLREK